MGMGMMMMMMMMMMLLLLLPLLVLGGCTTSCAAARLSLRSLRACAYDPVVARWEVAGEIAANGSASLALFDAAVEAGRPLAQPLSLVRLPPYEAPVTSSPPSPRELYDELGGPTALPHVLQMLWRKDEWTLSIEFERRTSTPDLRTAQDLARVLILNPPLSSGTCKWNDDGRWLVIHVNAPDDVERIDAAFQAQTFTALVGPWPPAAPVPASVMGEETVRVGLPGDYWLALVVESADGATDVVATMAAGPLKIEACSRETVLHDFSRQDRLVQPRNDDDDDDDDAVEEEKEAAAAAKKASAPWFEARGVFASTGGRSMTIPDVELPGRGRGDWSLSLWVFLAESPTGVHRGLFFKGAPATTGGQRTPSAWFLPDSNRLALRVSTVDSDDVGAETDHAIHADRWTHLAFAFSNRSSATRSAAEEDHDDHNFYVFSSFVDGVHESTLSFSRPVEANVGPLHIGKDPERAGFRGMMADVKIWPVALTRRAAAAEYARTRSTYYDAGAMAAFQTPPQTALALHVGKGARANNEHVEEALLLLSDVAVTLSAAAWDEAVEATERCAAYATRLESYEAVTAGPHFAAARRRAGELILFGAERLDTGPRRCKDRLPTLDGAAVRRAAAHLRAAAALDDAAAARELATLSLSGIVDMYGDDASSSSDDDDNEAAPPPPAQMMPSAAAAAAVVVGDDAGGGGSSKDERGSSTAAKDSKEATTAALTLLFKAASLGDARASLALATQYGRRRSLSSLALLEPSSEAASWYARAAAATATREYHTPGEQTHMEFDRLSDDRAEEAPKRQRGDEDAELRAQVMRAEAGDMAALVATADLFYWGARGFERDHGRARGYLRRAAEADDAHARCLYAAMLLRGEGGEKDHDEAVRQWELAAKAGSAKALNGLGYEYFYGHALAKNATRAYGYFAEAARLGADGDSLFNAAHCLDHGLGTARDVAQAAALYEEAATRFGHFDAALQLAEIRDEGRGGTQRDASRAFKYFEPVARAGWAARDVRAGFDRYLDHDEARALVWYAEAAYVGYDVATVNAAWLLDRSRAARGVIIIENNKKKKKKKNDNHPRSAALRFHHMALDAGGAGAADAAASIADAHTEPLAKLHWYSKAAQLGSARATLAMAQLHARGDGAVLRHRDRARRLFRSALEQQPSTQMHIAVYIGLGRLAVDEFIDTYNLDVTVLVAVLVAVLVILALTAASSSSSARRPPPARLPAAS